MKVLIIELGTHWSEIEVTLWNKTYSVQVTVYMGKPSHSVNMTSLFCKLRANTSLSVFIIPVIAESQAEIYIQSMFRTATPSLYRPKVKCNNFIIILIVSTVKVLSKGIE